jgi:hypothetical protein
MQRVDLKKVLEMLINEEQGNAEDLLHQWFVEKTKTIHESLMQEDDDVLEKEDLTKGIEDDKDSIESEEYFGEADFDEEGDEDSHIDAIAAADVAKGGNLATDDLDGEDAEGFDGEDAEGLDGEEGGEPDLAEISDKVEDLESELERLKSKFQAIQGGDESEDDGLDDPDSEGDDAGIDSPLGGDEDAEGEEPGDDVEEGFLNEFDFVDLDEAFTLELIKDPGLSGSKEVGATGASVNVNSTSPIPQKKTTERVGGKTVEIKSTQHKGYERETAPAVGQKNPLRNQSVGNSYRDYTPISKEGDKAAILNKKGDGFGSDSPKSPIGAGATDLRGDTFKRK